MTARQTKGLKVSEAAFQASVIELLRLNGWRLIFHAPDNRPAGKTGAPQRLIPEAAGFPDVIAIHPIRRVGLAAELKSDGGKVRAGQREWIEAFTIVGFEAHLWRPADWEGVVAVVAGTRRPPTPVAVIEAAVLLRELTGAETGQCRLEADGECQEHGFLPEVPGEECFIPRANRWLERYDRRSYPQVAPLRTACKYEPPR